LESLTEETDALVAAGTLTADQGDGLLGKLGEVTKSLDSGATRAACGQLQAYIKQVKGFIKAGKLSPQEGQNLIVAAESIRARIGC
jgi:hypothetical protein